MMAGTVNNNTQAGDKPASTSLFEEIKNYLLKVKNIGDAKTLNLLKRAKQTMRTLKTSVIMKNMKFNASQMMNKITKIMQKINQKMDNLKKKNSNIMKKKFVEMTRNLDAFTPQKINESKQTLNVRMMTMHINSDVDKKKFTEKSTRDLIN